MAKILIVEDEVSFAGKLREYLQVEQHVVDMAHSAEDGWQFLQAYKYDVLIFDWNLPGMSGVDLCKKFRADGGSTPVLMLTGKSAIDEKEMGFNSGADDYLSKPFDVRELTARIRALTRRKPLLQEQKVTVGNLILDSSATKLTRDGQDVQLQPKEFVLLEYLMKNPNQVFSSKVLLERLWDADKEASEDTIRTYMKTLRRKISSSEEVCPIKTVHGLGYKLETND